MAARSDLPKVTSQLALMEVVRVCCRLDPQPEPAARQLLGGLDLALITAAVAELATHVGGALSHSLDAIHLPTALSFRDGAGAGGRTVALPALLGMPSVPAASWPVTGLLPTSAPVSP